MKKCCHNFGQVREFAIYFVMEIQEFLSQLGLTHKQIRIYTDLAQNPDSTVVQISRRTGLPRSSIYTELDQLIDKGYVHFKKVGKSTKFKITDPRNIKYELDEKSRLIAQLQANADQFVSQLLSGPATQKSHHSINVYEGQAGIKQILWNILSTKEKLVVGYSHSRLEQVVDHDFAERWREEFRRREIRNKMILNKPVKVNWSTVPDFLGTDWVQLKTLQQEKISFDREIFMYDDTLTIISPKTDPEQYGVEITDKFLVDSYRQIFNFLWEHVAQENVSPAL